MLLHFVQILRFKHGISMTNALCRLLLIFKEYTMSWNGSFFCGTSKNWLVIPHIFQQQKIIIWSDYIFPWIDSLVIDIKISFTDSLMYLLRVLCGHQLRCLSWWNSLGIVKELVFLSLLRNLLVNLQLLSMLAFKFFKESFLKFYYHSFTLNT